MKIAIDISQTAHEGTGVARYMQTMVKSLLQYDSINSYTFFFASFRKKINEDLKKLILKKAQLKIYRIPPTTLDILWNKMHIVPIEYFVGKQDLIITSDWTEPPSKAKKITILHDLIVFLHSEISHDKTKVDISSLQISPNIVETQKRKLNWMSKESQMIICDSISTKNDAKKILNIPERCLRVIYPAVTVSNISDSRSNEINKKYNLSKKYILSVGKVEPRKNIKRLIEAFKKTSLSDIDLVIIGNLGWEENEIMQSTENVKFLGYVSDEELYSIYKKALCFIYPSIYEGFGLPLVEAMNYGCPVGSSNTSSMKEVTEGFGLLFNPFNQDEIEITIKKLVQDNELRDKLSILSLKRAKDFTEEKFASEWMKIFNTIEKS